MERVRTAERPLSNGIGSRSIPDDVLVSLIFVRLPVRSVVAVRLVCKSWYVLTTSPCFILSHARRASSTDIAFESKERNILYHVSLNGGAARRRLVVRETPRLAMGYSNFSLLASCDGLLFFRFGGGHRNRRWRRRIRNFVCNPVTKEWLNVPARSVQDFIVAFYFHSSTGEHRLLLRRDYGRDIGYRYEVFSFGGSADRAGAAAAWRPINASSGFSSIWRSHLSVLHGNVHFLSSQAWLKHFPVLHDRYYQGDCDCILAFDTNTEEFRKMSLPPRLHLQGYNDNDLIEMGGGSLGLWQINKGSKEMDIWCLKDYTKEEWVKQYTVSLADISNSILCIPLAVWDDRKELLLKCAYGGRFVLINLESNETSETEMIDKLIFLQGWVPHKETLVSCHPSLKST